MDSVKSRNYWTSTLNQPEPRPTLIEANQCDVAIIGAGFTGLWTAYYLKKLSPDLAITVVEAERIGHGASGRNGGWVIGSISGLDRYIGDLSAEQRQATCRLLTDNVTEIGHVLERENIAADFHQGGSISAAARYPDQVPIQQRKLAHLRQLGYEENMCYWLDANALDARARFHNGYGGIFHPFYATVNPGKLVTGLANVVENLGVRLYEHSRAITIEPGRVNTAVGRIDAPMVVAATEGYSDGLRPLKRHIMPVQSLVIATESLSDTLWRDIGLADRESFADASRIVNYGHRTADNRIVFGARGDYRFGGKPKHVQAITDEAVEMRRKLLIDIFPPLKGVAVEYGWGGSVGLSRGFRPHAVVDRRRGFATAGGYAGEGVAAAHLFARTLTERILEMETDRTCMPWVYPDMAFDQAIRCWEPEPFRWLSASVISASYALEETLMRRRSGTVPRIKSILSRLNNFFSAIFE